MKNIILTGFMGTGKSVVGRIIAEKLGLEFVDTDKLIEERTGMTIPEIFAEMGEERFRKVESEILSEVCGGSGRVVSTGGGAVTVEQNIEMMKESGPLVALTASVDEIYERVKNETHRPLLGSSGRKAKIREILKRRERYYAMADITIDTTGKSPEAVADEIMVKLERITARPGAGS